jgi:hypothetical protein
MRRSEAAVALIRSDRDGQTLWLAQWNPRWGAYHFVREVTEELGLREEVDFHAAPERSVHLEYSA